MMSLLFEKCSMQSINSILSICVLIWAMKWSPHGLVAYERVTLSLPHIFLCTAHCSVPHRLLLFLWNYSIENFNCFLTSVGSTCTPCTEMAFGLKVCIDRETRPFLIQYYESRRKTALRLRHLMCLNWFLEVSGNF